jgi:hypothetical protein
MNVLGLVFFAPLKQFKWRYFGMLDSFVGLTIVDYAHETSASAICSRSQNGDKDVETVKDLSLNPATNYTSLRTKQ